MAYGCRQVGVVVASGCGVYGCDVPVYLLGMGVTDVPVYVFGYGCDVPVFLFGYRCDVPVYLFGGMYVKEESRAGEIWACMLRCRGVWEVEIGYAKEEQGAAKIGGMHV